MAFVIPVLAQTIGVLFSAVIPTLFINEEDYKVKSSDFTHLLTIKAIIASFSLITAFGIRSKPDQPPAESQNIQTLNIKESYKNIFSRKDFYQCVLICGVCYGVINGITGLL